MIQRSTYHWVFVALILLLLLTMVGAFIPIHWLATVVAFAIGTAKAILIVLYFMHVKESSTTVRVFGVAAILWLAILIGGTLHDYLGRGLLGEPF